MIAVTICNASASFPLLSSSSFSLLQFPSPLEPFFLSTASLARLFIGKWALRAKAACPGDLKLSVEATSLPRQVGFFTMKLFGGLDESEASLGKLVSRKTKEKTLLPPLFLVFFAFLIKTLNIPLFCTAIDIQHHKPTSKDQKINER